MARSIVLGNGNIFVGLDMRGQVRDFYFPYVGLENHIRAQNIHRVGVFANNTLRWFAHHSWEITTTCKEESLSGITSAINSELEVSLIISDSVYNERNILIRKAQVKNHSREKRQIKIFFGQEFNISESRRADTAFFDPVRRAIIHYKGRRVFLINAATDKGLFDDYTTGVFGAEGKQGSFYDAEDGLLSKNNIEHGQADSVIGVTLDIEPGGEKTIFYWICASDSIEHVQTLNQRVLDKTPQYLMQTTENFWKAWVNKYHFTFHGLNEEVISLFKKSLFYVRASVDEKGAILASGDTDTYQEGGKDTYNYTWPRDGAFCAMALDRAGDFNIARKFFEFCNDVITDEGYLMHKYRPDKALGSSWHPWVRNDKVQLPIQEDETALVLVALWKHYALSRDLEFIEKIFNTFIRKAAGFMVKYRDPKTGLPSPSYDLWEEKFGIHTFTAATVYSALQAAARFAQVLGKTDLRDEYQIAARGIKEAILNYLYDDRSGLFYKGLQMEKDGTLTPDRTVDMSSVFGIYAFDVLSPNDKKVRQAVEKTIEIISIKTPVGGIARYEHDDYHRQGVSGPVPGNPWFITTLWYAQYQVKIAQKEEDLSGVKEILSWAVKHGLSSGVMSEQIHPHTGEQVSVAPLTWSHAEFVLTVIAYLDKLEELGISNVNFNPVD